MSRLSDGVAVALATALYAHAAHARRASSRRVTASKATPLDDPFCKAAGGASVSTEDRLADIKNFDYSECAQAMRGHLRGATRLQLTVLRSLETRMRKLRRQCAHE